MFYYSSNSTIAHQSVTNCYNNKSSQLTIVMIYLYYS